jgi:TonB family protein
MKLFAGLLMLACLCNATLAQQALRFERQAVELVQRVPVSTLEENMPRRSFGEWFGSVVGIKSGIVWQLSECDQFAEINPRGSDAPACVEANALLPDGRKVMVRVGVGTFLKGVTGAPGFYYAVIEQRDQLYVLNRLRDLPDGLRFPDRLQQKSEFRLTPPKLNSDQALSLAGKTPPPSRPDSEPPPPPPPTSVSTQGELRRVSEGALIGAAIRKVGPVYPAGAKGVGAWGEVQVLVTISLTGQVIDARVVSGHLLLRKSAIAAARQWTFSPTILNGTPVSVQGVITFDFPRP